MGLDLKTLATAKKNIKESLAGAGVVQGKPGKDGSDGKSAYQVAIDNGYNGTESEWLESLKSTEAIEQLKNDFEELQNNKNNYDKLQNKPRINGVILEGDKNLDELGMKPLSNMEIIQIINKATI